MATNSIHLPRLFENALERLVMADVESLAAITGLDPEEAAILLDAAGGDMEMAVSLHYGDQADEDLYWDEEGDDLLDSGDKQQGVREQAVQLVNRLEARQQRAALTDKTAKKRDKKSRAKVRREEAEALVLVAEQAAAAREPAERMAGTGSTTCSKIAVASNNDDGARTKSGAVDRCSAASDDGDSDAGSTSESSSEEEWVDDDWFAIFVLRVLSPKSH